MGSCEKFVDIDLPDTQLSGPLVFENISTANAALSHLYIKLREDGLPNGSFTGMSYLMGYYADEMDLYNTTVRDLTGVYNNGILPLNGYSSTFWSTSYNLIFAANSLLEGLNQSGSIADTDKEKLKGEALFIRSYIYFHLVNIFGPVPYITTSDYRTNSKARRTPVDSIYAEILNDLVYAKSVLPATYPSVERARPNKSVVSALLSRIHLYKGNWQAAETEASLVIDNGLYIWVDQPELVFLKGSTGTVWQLSPGSFSTFPKENNTFYFLTGPPSNGAMTQSLLNAFEPDDLRRLRWTGSVTDGSNTWYYPYKYKDRQATAATVKEYSIIMRIEEQYLIRAEALTRLGKLDDARDDIDKIRLRAGLQPTTAATEDELLAAILQERRVELFTEHGHRWFDLKRTGQADPVLRTIKANWNITDTLWPIPQNEMLLNAELRPQNAGY